MSKTNYKNQLNTENLTIIKAKNKSWYKGREIAILLGYKNANDATIKHVTNKNKNHIQNSKMQINTHTK